MILLFHFYKAYSSLSKFADVNIQSLFNEGNYVIAQGGFHFLINHHYLNRGQQWALDIVKVNSSFSSRRKFIPTQLSDYNIYNDSLHSPCNGVVIRVKDGVEDNNVNEKKKNVPATGNSIEIRCYGMDNYVTFAHLKNNSIPPHLSEGYRVSINEEIGRIGNSGNSTEPHLHLQVNEIKTGESVPIRFNGIMPLRNFVFRL